MRIFLLTVTLLVASAAAAPGTKSKRDILKGDPRYGTEYHLKHLHAHSSSGSGDLTQYLPPAQPSNQYIEPVAAKQPETHQTFELPSTSYGVPFNTQEAQAAPAPQVQTVSNQYLVPVAAQAPVNSYGTPIINEVEIQQQVQHIEQHEAHAEHHAAPVAHVPHTSYGVPVQQQVHHQVQQQVHHYVHQPAPVPHQSYGPPAQVHHQVQHVHLPAPQVQHVHQPAPQVQHVHQPAQVPHQSYGPPAQQVYQPAPQVQHVHHQPAPQVQQVHQPAPVYGVPVQQQHHQVHHQVHHVHQPAQQVHHQVHHQVQQQQHHHHHHQVQQQSSNGGYNYPAPAQRLVIEAPVQSVELSQSHSVESIPEHHHESVSIESVRNSAQSSHGYQQQQTASNGGYVY